MLLIQNGFIKPMEGQDIERGCVLVDGRRIVAVGAQVEAPVDAEVIDAKGFLVTPGLIDGHCHIGMMEEGIGYEGDDVNEITDPITPHLRGIDGLNPRCIAFREALEGGVTVAVTGPGSANVVGGQFAAIKTFGGMVDEMVIKAPAAMKCAFGENPKRFYGDMKKAAPMTRMANAAMLRETLFKAQEYAVEKRKAEQEGKSVKFDIKLEAMLPVLNRVIPLKAHAHRIDDMFTALRIAKEFNVRITLDHCTEAHLDTRHLKGAECAGFFLGPTLGNRSKYELKEQSFDTARILYEAGIEFAIITDAPVIPLQHLPLCAGLAVKSGLPEDEAWRAITINPARIVNISERVGSLVPGKDADIAIFQGNPLMDISAKTVLTLVDGKIAFDGR